MKPHAGKHKKDEGLLTTVAESIGSTMGTILGKANAAQKALTHTPEVRKAKSKGKKLIAKIKKAGRGAKVKRKRS